MTTSAKPKLKKARTQQSMWLMLGSAMLLSLGGFAAIAQQSMTPAVASADAASIQVVELPTPVPDTGVTVSRPSVAQSAPSTNNLRHITRPVMRSHSSN